MTSRDLVRPFLSLTHQEQYQLILVRRTNRALRKLRTEDETKTTVAKAKKLLSRFSQADLDKLKQSLILP